MTCDMCRFDRMFWSLSVTDISEIARNSVLHSGFPHQRKVRSINVHF